MTIQNSLGFNDDGDYLSRTSSLLNFNSAYTAMAWVRFDSFVNYGHIWGEAVDSTDFNGNWVNSDMMGHDNQSPGTTRIGACYQTNGYDFPTGALFAASTWTHVCLRRTSATLLELFLNGSSTATASTTFSVSGRSAAGGAYLGRLNGAYGTRGRIALVKEWTVALTTAEILAERDKAYAVKTANLNDVWKFAVGGSKLVGINNGVTWTSNGTITDETGPDLDEPAAPAASFPPRRAIRHAYYHF